MNLLSHLRDIWNVSCIEFRRIFSDGGVVLLFCIATLLYPFIFGAVYSGEMVRNLPIAVVDESHCEESQRFIRKLDATPEMNVCYDCNTLQEAQTLMRMRKINGIVYFPADYGNRLAHLETARASLFCDMSSFLYYRSVLSGASAVLLDEIQHIETDRFGRTGITGENAEQLVEPIPYDDVKLYISNGGFGSFLIPALLILVLHQTLFLGMGILYGTSREQNLSVESIPIHLRGRSVFRVVIGRALTYFAIYVPMTAIVLLLFPRLFQLPHIGNISSLVLFLIPFLLATIFFCMTICNFVRARDTGVVVCIFFSVILVFLSGAVWPQAAMPKFWLYFSYIFPSTHGIQGFIRINSMGADLSQVKFEYLMLWAQAGVYFVTATSIFRTLCRHKSVKGSDIHADGLNPEA
ncbi:MAG: ABC transporter permease [Bacteroidales bacterium]|nr:ABC transporter permease [Candidatus Colimorpha onthohippi]